MPVKCLFLVFTRAPARVVSISFSFTFHTKFIYRTIKPIVGWVVKLLTIFCQKIFPNFIIGVIPLFSFPITDKTLTLYCSAVLFGYYMHTFGNVDTFSKST